LIVYNDGEGDHHQHLSYITPEAFYALKEMLDYREQVQGEKITGESWLITNEKVGFATAPKKLEYEGVKKILNRALKMEGLRNVLPKGKRRYEWKQSHGYRKFFETHAGSVMHPYNVKLLIDHKLEGSENSYWKPTEMTLLEDYLKAVPKLTINNQDNIDKSVLQKEVAELKEKSEQQNAEKEKEAEETKKEFELMKAKQEIFEANFENLILALTDKEFGVGSGTTITPMAQIKSDEILLKAAARVREDNQTRKVKFEKVREKMKTNPAEQFVPENQSVELFDKVMAIFKQPQEQQTPPQAGEGEEVNLKLAYRLFQNSL
jgi:hypothetical protein